LVVCNCSPETRSAEIVLRPNPAWPWRNNMLLLGALLVVSLAIGTYSVLHGLWAVPLWSAVELGVLAWALYRISREAQRQEVLRFREEELVLECGYETPNERHVFNRPWTRFEVRPPRHRWYRPRIEVCSRGEAREIGAFLSPDDHDLLLASLRRVIAALDSAPAGATSAPPDP
jgi:uncharacterized membrane protein